MHSSTFIAFFAIFFSVPVFISINNTIKLCFSFNLKAFERQLKDKMCPDSVLFTIFPVVFSSIYALFQSFCSMAHLYIAVRQYGYFWQQLFWIISSCSAHILTCMYEALCCSPDVLLWSLFGTQYNTDMNFVFVNLGRWPLALLPTGSHKSIAGHLLPCISQL